MNNTTAALQMLDIFASVGAVWFDITHKHLDGEKRGFRPKQTIEQTRASLPYLVPAAERRQNNLILRPHNPPGAALIQLDDIPPPVLSQLDLFAFLVIETSPGNFQAWVAVEGADRDFARRLRLGTGADITASGATRTAGTRNFKPKYAPSFPLVKIAVARPAHLVTRAELEKAGLVAPEAPPARVSRPRSAKKWPSYQRCLDQAPLNPKGTAPDVSRADFAWCVIAIDWGHSVEEVAERLAKQSVKAPLWEPYALLTAQNAAAAVARRAAGQSTPS